MTLSEEHRPAARAVVLRSNKPSALGRHKKGSGCCGQRGHAWLRRAKENKEVHGKEEFVLIKRRKKANKYITQGLAHEFVSALVPQSAN